MMNTQKLLNSDKAIFPSFPAQAPVHRGVLRQEQVLGFIPCFCSQMCGVGPRRRPGPAHRVTLWTGIPHFSTCCRVFTCAKQYPDYISFCLLSRFGRCIFILVFPDVVHTIYYNLKTGINTGKLFESAMLTIPLQGQALLGVGEGYLSGIVGSSPQLVGLFIMSSPRATLH